jgi:hypothetical protein
MSLTKLSLDGNNLIIPGQEYFVILFPCPGTILLFPARESLLHDIPAGDGKIDHLFYSAEQ